MNENIGENNNHKSIRDIEISNRRREFENRISNRDSEYNGGVSYKKKNKKKWPKILVIFVILAFILTGVSFAFHKATIEVRPKKETLIFSNDIYRASVSEEKIKEMDKKDVLINEKKGKISEGEIRIFNNTNKTQKLRKETRFQTEDGLVYKIYKAISIPSKKSVVAKAFSFGGGEKYQKENGEKLTIPGFKEAKMDEEFKNITGEIESSFKMTDKNFELPASEKVDDTKKEESVDEIKSMGVVKYNILEVSSELSAEVESIGVEETKKQSQGKIRIFNNTNKTQKLRKETRFRNGGMIFKTYKSVTIPSKTSVVVDAFADLPGSQFNIKKGIKFDVPGFEEAKMKEEFEKIYGVAEIDFNGGVEGKILVPNKDKMEEVKEKLKEDMISDLKLKVLKNSTKTDFITIEKNNPFMDFDYKTSFRNDKILVKLMGKAKIPVVSKNNFMEAILLSDSLRKEEIKNLDIDDFSKLDFKILNRDDFAIDSGEDFLFSINGEVVVYWILDKNTFLSEIKGKDLDEINNLLQNSFINFEFTFNTSPFWRSSVPSNKDAIEIVIEK